MDYQKIYNDLCSSRQKLRGSSKRLRKNEGDFTYYERHHIIPRSMGGGNEPGNMVLLTHREHIIAHRLLHVIYPEDSGMALALTLMLQLNVTQDEHGKRIISGNELSTKEAEEVRKLYSQAASGENNPRYGVIMSEETKEKIRQKALLNNKGEKNPRYGAKLSEETKDRIRQKALGRKYSKERKKQISETMKKANPFKGKTFSEDTKRLIHGFKDGSIVVLSPEGIQYHSFAEAGRDKGFKKSTVNRWVRRRVNGWKLINPNTGEEIFL